MNNFFKNILVIFTMTLSSVVFAEGKSSGGDEFRKTAKEYDAKAEKYAGKGMGEVATLYTRMAEIKREAAKMGDQGRWEEIDWTEYQEIEGKISQLLNNMKYKKKY